MIYLVPIIASGLASILRLRTRTLWLLVAGCFIANPITPQYWGVYHYVLGTRYFEDVGYFNLYECTAAVTGDTTRRNLVNYEFRFDQANCDMAPSRARDLLVDLNRVRFEPGMLTDKGLNATPAWLGVFGMLADLPVGLIIMIDPIALLIALLVAGRLIGWRQTAYAALFLLTFYGTFNRLWGHFAQWVWLALCIAGVAMMKRRAWGAALIGAAAGLAIFPVFLMASRKRGLRWFLFGLVLTLSLGLFTSRGPGAYLEFIDNMRLHSGYIRTEPYNIGLANTVHMIVNPDVQAEYRQCFVLGDCAESYTYRTTPVHYLLLPLVAATSYGLMFGVLTLSRYYYLILAVMTLEHSERYTRGLLGLNAVLFAWWLLDWHGVYVYGSILWIAFFAWLGLRNSRQGYRFILQRMAL